MDIHQSEKYGRYMEKIGWIVEKVNACQIFIRRFPLIGSLIKIQRPNLPIPLKKIEELARRYRAFQIITEPQAKSLLRWWPREVRRLADEVGTPRTVGRSDKYEELASKTSLTIRQLKSFGYKKSNSPYLPTKTIHIDLTQPEQKILRQLKKKTRYCLRRAQKSRLIVKEPKDIEGFIRLKSRYFFPFSFLIKKEIKTLWKTFYPGNTVLLLAYQDIGANYCSKNLTHSSHPELDSGSPAMKIPKRVRNDNLGSLAGVLLLFHKNTAHYWLAASTKEGKKLFAPTLLVWQALKVSKKRGCKIFDFQGIYDSRFHKATKNWQGFTRFKKGFGGKEIEYLGCFVKYHLPISSSSTPGVG